MVMFNQSHGFRIRRRRFCGCIRRSFRDHPILTRGKPGEGESTALVGTGASHSHSIVCSLRFWDQAHTRTHDGLLSLSYGSIQLRSAIAQNELKGATVLSSLHFHTFVQDIRASNAG